MDDLSTQKYLFRFDPIENLTLVELQKELDRVWDECGLDNKEINNQDEKLKEFYGHPVWILNGLFSEYDPESRSHRIVIAKYVLSKKLNRVADYGGGSGVLAKMIGEFSSKTKVDIIEPYYSGISVEQGNVRNIKNYDGKYDLIIFQDVLEHMQNPLIVLKGLKSKLTNGGKLVFANCFYPSIKCHLPCTFYLRWTFRAVMFMYGFKYEGHLEKYKHIQIYGLKNNKDYSFSNTQIALTKIIGMSLNFLINQIFISYLKKILNESRKYI